MKKLINNIKLIFTPIEVEKTYVIKNIRYTVAYTTLFNIHTVWYDEDLGYRAKTFTRKYFLTHIDK